jgi:hypothetical protein
MRLAYCRECEAVIAAGDLPDKVKKVVQGKWVEVEPTYSHVVKGKTHLARLVEVSSCPVTPGEAAGAYLKRLTKNYNRAALT